jgi:alpha-mannosidase
MLTVHMIGNAHLDPVWLWRWQQGADEALATFRSAADRCDEYPEFLYTRGEAWLYRLVERLDPELFARIHCLVDRGQWHITGGQVIQPDANLPTAIGWQRQFLHGQRYFLERFGIRPTIAYNVDTFGHPATLPDILEAAGCVGYVFHRPTPLQVDLPANVFRWRGPGGGEVMGMRLVPAYVTFGADLSEQILGAAQAVTPGLEHVMCFYGVGNHGGGPTKAHIEYIRDHLHAFPGIELRFSTPDLFYAAVRPSWEVLPVVAADLELQHTFPGCYSVMHEIKQRQSATEHLLAQSERVIETFVSHPDEKRALRSKLDAAWEDLLFTQFHDILAGACIGPAYTAVRALQGRALISGEEIIYDATRRWARQVLPPINEQQMVVLNADDEPWEGLVEAEPSLDFDAWGQRWLSDLRGQPVPFQRVQAAGHLMTHRILFPLRVEVRDAQQLLLRTDAPPSFSPLETDLDVSPDYLANGRMRVEVDQHGICQIWLDERPLLSANGISLHLRADGTDTWVMESDAFTRPVESLFSSQAEQWTVEEGGPLRARIRLEGWLGHSRVRWTLSLLRHEPRLFIELDVHFCDHLKLLQMPVHLAETPLAWRDGQAMGAVERRIHVTDRPVEWPVQGWSKMTLSQEHEVALVTNDAYSVSVSEEGGWQWTLLRSPRAASVAEGWASDVFLQTGRDSYTDQGEHHFQFQFLASRAVLSDALLEKRAQQQVQPPIVFDRYEGLNRPPWGATPPQHLQKPLETNTTQPSQ